MRVFVTGASGWVGTGVVRDLVAAGHKVKGLARSEAAAGRVSGNGATVVRGEIGDLDVLGREAGTADAVIHTAFIHDFSNYMASVAADRQAILTMGVALRGSHKPFLVTTGVGTIPTGPLRSENDVADTSRVPRVSEPTALTLVPDGVRVGIVRLPPSVHGSGDHGFVHALVEIARAKGASGYVESGDNRWPSVHRDDAARLYGLALTKGEAGQKHHAIDDEGVPFRAIADLIGQRLGLPVVSVSRDRAKEHFGWMGDFVQFDAPASSAITRARLGWAPVGPDLLTDLREGTYFD